MAFAIHHVSTSKNWDELVFNSSTRQQIDGLRSWLQQHKNIPYTSSRLRDGYTALFIGPEGTGKSLTAAILARESGAEIYKVDLSQLVSKYIGETEKNINNLFIDAEAKGWILFFDEADALFGKRTDVKDAHDRYANIEIGYLLQKIESFHGLTIVATNKKANIDDAFLRRFQSIIHFPLPTGPERKRIWEGALTNKKLVLATRELDLLADQYELSPGSIMRAVDYVKEKSSDETTPVSYELLRMGIQKEGLK